MFAFVCPTYIYCTIISVPVERNVKAIAVGLLCCGGFFPRLRGYVENVRLFIHRLPFFLSFFFLFFFFFKLEISSRTLIPHFKPRSVHSGSASRDDCSRVFPDKLCVSSFTDRFPHYAWTAAQSTHSDFVGSRVHACLCVTCHLHFDRMTGVSHVPLR